MVKAHEAARSHRHTPNALRLVVEGGPAGIIERTTVVDEAPSLRFAFSETRDQLDRAPEVRPGLRDVLLGPTSLDTLDLHVLRLEPSHTWAEGRSTANSVFGVIQGDGASVIDGQRFAWSSGDVFVVPAWRAHSYTVERRSFLLRVTDERVMKQLGWLRQEEA
jgi:gentisate 1,2-dioxygenase